MKKPGEDKKPQIKTCRWLSSAFTPPILQQCQPDYSEIDLEPGGFL
jgi:hypothetical protein